MLKAMQQQFECMNLMFGEIRDKLERQDTAISNLKMWQQLITLNVRGNQGRTTMGEEDGDDLDILMTRPPLTCVEEIIEGQDV